MCSLTASRPPACLHRALITIDINTRAAETKEIIQPVSAAAATAAGGGLPVSPDHWLILPTPRRRCPSSRRFKVNGAEYKWKLAENGTDMIVSVRPYSP